MRKFIAIFIAKQAAFWSRIFGRGGGGALPGLLALKIDPTIVTELTKNLEKGVILVTGTNGKTTTSKMIVGILEASGLKVLSNSGGSNLARGIASELTMKSNIFGDIKEEIGVYEVDEATMPEVIGFVKPKAIVITNIFRDQLDRYGEVDKTATILKKAIDFCPESTLILNADDPIVASLGASSVIPSEIEGSLENHGDKGISPLSTSMESVEMTKTKNQKEVIFFGITDERLEAKSNLAIDIKDCVICGNELVYPHRYYGHIGLYVCENCGFARPKTKVTAKSVRLSPESTAATVILGRESVNLNIPITGLYSLYNAIAAISVGGFMKIENKTIFGSLKKLTPAFGRMESFEIEGKHATIHLVKNPTGFNQVLEAVTQNRKNKTALIVLNDNFADGTDISWIWDTEFELFKMGFRKIVISGIRSEDLRLRLKYADVTSRVIEAEKDLKTALDKVVSGTKTEENIYILPTYTAMLSLRNILVQKGILKDYWAK